MKSILIGFVGLFLVSCGSDVAKLGGKNDSGGGKPAETPSDDPKAKDANPSNHSMYVADTAALPTCDAAAEGWLVYVKAEAKFKACLEGAWTDVMAPTANFTPQLQFLCLTTGDLDVDPTTETWGSSTFATKFSNGDFAVTCMDHRSDSTYTYGDTSTNQVFLSASSAGVTSGSIGCVTYYASVHYNIAANTATWVANSGGAPQTVACTPLQ